MLSELNSKQDSQTLQVLYPRELNAKQACMLAFMTFDKVSLVTIITSDISSVIILIDINLLLYMLAVCVTVLNGILNCFSVMSILINNITALHSSLSLGSLAPKLNKINNSK